MAQVIIFAYSDNKFYATLTTRAQTTTSASTCVPASRFCCLKICGWDSVQTFVKSPGSLGTITVPAPVHVHERRIPDPHELSIKQIPGGGMVTPGIDSCIMGDKSDEELQIMEGFTSTSDSDIVI